MYIIDFPLARTTARAAMRRAQQIIKIVAATTIISPIAQNSPASATERDQIHRADASTQELQAIGKSVLRDAKLDPSKYEFNWTETTQTIVLERRTAHREPHLLVFVRRDTKSTLAKNHRQWALHYAIARAVSLHSKDRFLSTGNNYRPEFEADRWAARLLSKKGAPLDELQAIAAALAGSHVEHASNAFRASAVEQGFGEGIKDAPARVASAVFLACERASPPVSFALAQRCLAAIHGTDKQYGHAAWETREMMIGIAANNMHDALQYRGNSDAVEHFRMRSHDFYDPICSRLQHYLNIKTGERGNCHRGTPIYNRILEFR